jgi:hypothetical protein
MPQDIFTIRPALLRLSSGTSACDRYSGASVFVSSVSRTAASVTSRPHASSFVIMPALLTNTSSWPKLCSRDSHNAAMLSALVVASVGLARRQYDLRTSPDPSTPTFMISLLAEELTRGNIRTFTATAETKNTRQYREDSYLLNTLAAITSKDYDEKKPFSGSLS